MQQCNQFRVSALKVLVGYALKRGSSESGEGVSLPTGKEDLREVWQMGSSASYTTPSRRTGTFNI